MMTTMYGCEIVWSLPIGRGAVAVADATMSSGTNSWRGTDRMADSTRGSFTPRETICSATMRRRSSARRRPSLRCSTSRGTMSFLLAWR
jgi:hypothetical protein